MNSNIHLPIASLIAHDRIHEAETGRMRRETRRTARRVWSR